MTRYDYTGDGYVDELTGQVGTRIPHAELTDGCSTLDLCGPGYVVLAGRDAPTYREVVPVDRVGLGADGAVLVRPDQHVAARSDDGLSPDTVRAFLPR
ncbi:aromatic-ring hydroxylase C-terminal domain-containing protein [Kribbella sp. WER1]